MERKDNKLREGAFLMGLKLMSGDFGGNGKWRKVVHPLPVTFGSFQSRKC
jgi:hypothetical protein